VGGGEKHPGAVHVDALNVAPADRSKVIGAVHQHVDSARPEDIRIERVAQLEPYV
jgi:hypothetical protein